MNKIKMSFNVEFLVDMKDTNISEWKLDGKELLEEAKKLLKEELEESFGVDDEEQQLLDVKVKRLKLERVE